MLAPEAGGKPAQRQAKGGAGKLGQCVQFPTVPIRSEVL